MTKREIEHRLGAKIRTYVFGPKKHDEGYADPGQDTIQLWIVNYLALRRLCSSGRRAKVTWRQGRALYVACHELGHLNQGNSEVWANDWAYHNIAYVALERLGLGSHKWAQVWKVCRAQALL